MTNKELVTEAIESCLHEYIHERDISVYTPAEINNGYCRMFIADVVDYLGNPDDVVRHDASDVHSWIEYDGRHYDAETPRGVPEACQLPIWNRFPEDSHSQQRLEDEVCVLEFDD